MNKISQLDLKKFILGYYIFFIITLLIGYIYIPIILKAGIINDDWAIYEVTLLGYNYSELMKSWFIGSHYTRPVALVLLGSIGFIFEQKMWLYHLFNSSTWIISILIFGYILKKLLNNNVYLIFIILALNPIFSSSNIFSPAEQLQGTFSNFLSSISFLFMYFYVIKKSKIKLIASYLFIFFALLCYETAIVFLPMLIFLKNKCELNLQHLIKYNLKKILAIFLPLLIFIFIVFLYQYFMKNFLDLFKLLDSNNEIFKYQLFEPDIIQELIKYSFKPITLITHDVFEIYLRSVKFILKDKLSLIFLLFLSCLIIYAFIVNSKSNKKDYLYNFNYFDFVFLIIISYFLVIMIHVAGTSLPTLSGYANRGLCSFSIIFAIFVSISFNKILENNKLKNIRLLLISSISFFIFLHANSFIIHRDNYLNSTIIQSDISNNLSKLYKRNTIEKSSSIVFANIPTYSKEDFNKEVIFSSEVHDWPRAIYHRSNQIINSERIFKDKYCKNILTFKNNIFKGMRPSRSRKINKKVEYNFFSKYPRSVNLKNLNYVYIYTYEDKDNYNLVKINLDQIQIELKKIFNCI